MEFTEIRGTGNDYVYMGCFKETVRDPTKTAIRMSDRRFGTGSDGLTLVCPSRTVDCGTEMYNANDSQGIMCGSGIRCVGKYVYDHGLMDRDKRAIIMETLTGIKVLELETEGGRAVSATVDMGEATLTSWLPEDITMDGEQYRLMGTDVRNPHAVCYVDRVDSLSLERIGPALENYARFTSGRVDTEFVHMVDRKHLGMRVWERGNDGTQVCGIEAAASVIVSVPMGHTKGETEVALHGGRLVIRYDREPDHLFMTRPTVEVFRGSIDIPEKIYYD